MLRALSRFHYGLIIIVFSIFIGIFSNLNWVLVLVPAAVILLVFIFYIPFYGLMFLIISIGFEWRSSTAFSFTSYELILFYLSLVVLINYRRYLKDMKSKELFNPIILFFISYSIINALYSVELERGLSLVRGTVEAYLGYVLIVLMVKSRKELNLIIRCIIFSGILYSVLGILQHLTGDFGWSGFQYPRGYISNFTGIGDPMVRQANGGFHHFNTLSQYLIMILPIIVSLIGINLKKSFLNKAGLIISFIIVFSGLIFTYSRGGLLTFLLCVVLFLIFNPKTRKYGITIMILGVTSMISILIPYILNSSYGETFSLGLRMEIWKYALIEYTSSITNILFGTGQGSFTAVTGKYAPLYDPGSATIYNAHNIYILILFEMGLIGIILFLSIISIFLKKSIRIFRVTADEYKKSLSIGLMLGLIALLIQGLVDHAIWGQGFKLILFIYFGLIAIIQSRDNI